MNQLLFLYRTLLFDFNWTGNYEVLLHWIDSSRSFFICCIAIVAKIRGNELAFLDAMMNDMIDQAIALLTLQVHFRYKFDLALENLGGLLNHGLWRLLNLTREYPTGQHKLTLSLRVKKESTAAATRFPLSGEIILFFTSCNDEQHPQSPTLHTVYWIEITYCELSGYV